MSTLTITAKGQVTLRKDLLRHLGVEPGAQVEIDKLPDGGIMLRAFRPTGAISDVFNLLRQDGAPSLSIEEIDEIARQCWVDER